MLLGIGYGQNIDSPPATPPASLVSNMWQVTEATVGGIVQDLLQPAGAQGGLGRRRVLRGDAPDVRVRHDPRALHPRADLAVARGRQHLPVPAARRRAHLLGLAEKIRGRPIPFAVMERASVVGFMLVVVLFIIGLTNDIGRLTGNGFNVR